MVLQVADGSSDGSSDVFDSRLIEALPLAVVVCDADGRVVRFNNRADDLVGRHLRQGKDQLGKQLFGGCRWKRRNANFA